MYTVAWVRAAANPAAQQAPWVSDSPNHTSFFPEISE